MVLMVDIMTYPFHMNERSYNLGLVVSFATRKKPSKYKESMCTIYFICSDSRAALCTASTAFTISNECMNILPSRIIIYPHGSLHQPPPQVDSTST